MDWATRSASVRPIGQQNTAICRYFKRCERRHSNPRPPRISARGAVGASPSARSPMVALSYWRTGCRVLGKVLGELTCRLAKPLVKPNSGHKSAEIAPRRSPVRVRLAALETAANQRFSCWESARPHPGAGTSDALRCTRNQHLTRRTRPPEAVVGSKMLGAILDRDHALVPASPPRLRSRSRGAEGALAASVRAPTGRHLIDGRRTCELRCDRPVIALRA
jgi:hypothetical protein